MAEATLPSPAGESSITAVSTTGSGQIVRLADGRYGVVNVLNAITGEKVAVLTSGVWTLAKVASKIMLAGQRVYWNDTNNNADLRTGAGNRSVGIVVEDAAAADTTVRVELNGEPASIIDGSSGYTSLPVLTAGAPFVADRGGDITLALDATDEAQKVDALSTHSITAASGWRAEFEVNVITDGDNAALDVNVGMANATHASNADTITEAIFIHVDGNSANILAESDDGTTEVAATDTTVDLVEGTPFHVLFDASDEADIQVYINGVNVLPSSVFNIAVATGPLKFLAHVEKSGGAAAATVAVSNYRVWLTS